MLRQTIRQVVSLFLTGALWSNVHAQSWKTSGGFAKPANASGWVPAHSRPSAADHPNLPLLPLSDPAAHDVTEWGIATTRRLDTPEVHAPVAPGVQLRRGAAPFDDTASPVLANTDQGAHQPDVAPPLVESTVPPTQGKDGSADSGDAPAMERSQPVLERLLPAQDAAPTESLPLEPPAEPKEKAWFEKYRLRGYTQIRINHTTHHVDGTAPAQHPGDSSVGARESFLLRRARLIFSADISDHLSVYLQPEFASNVPGVENAIEFAQIRDWYGDVYFDDDKVFRVRVGKSKVPYGWEDLQSSSQRVPFDRNDAFHSAVRNEREVGAFFYWTPVEAQELFEKLADEGLKPTGNYGIFGIGVYNGQGGSFEEQNDAVHLAARLTWPWEFANGQIIETSIQGYTGEYVVDGAPIRPLGLGAVDVIPQGTREQGQREGHLDQRIGWTFVWYPQPLGLQAEWTIGRGPELNNAQTAIERDVLHGGYVMLLYRLQNRCGEWFPYARWQYFDGGYRSFPNAPHAEIAELEAGVEWQIRDEMELTLAYTFADRTNLNSISSTDPVSRRSYEQFEGQLLRVQFQFNY